MVSFRTELANWVAGKKNPTGFTQSYIKIKTSRFKANLGKMIEVVVKKKMFETKKLYLTCESVKSS